MIDGEFRARWRGRAAIGRGWALVDAEIGDHRPHRHLAVQISLGVNGLLTAALSEGVVRGRCLVIAGHVRHSLGPIGQAVRSLYIEPYGQLARTLGQRASIGGGAISDDALADAMTGESPSLLAALVADPVTIDLRVAGLARELGVDREPTSKSHMRALSQAELGASPARLRQWHRLQVAVRALSDGYGIAEAAFQAGFSDQAHFTRLLVRWFGVTPGRGLSGLDITVTD